MSEKKFNWIPRVVIKNKWDWLSVLVSLIFYFVIIANDWFLGSFLFLLYVLSSLFIVNVYDSSSKKKKEIKRNFWDYLILFFMSSLLGLPFFILSINYKLFGDRK